MEFKIACETFARLSNVCNRMLDNETRDYLRCLYVERRGGRLIALATNSMIAAIELLSEEAGPDEHCYVKFDPALIMQCNTESKFNGSLYIVSNDMLKYTAVKSMFGYVHPGNAGVFPDAATSVEGWRKWMPTKPAEKAIGNMQIEADFLANLGMSAPSRHLIFPACIDAHSPVICADRVDPKWFGVFMPGIKHIENATSFTLPKW